MEGDSYICRGHPFRYSKGYIALPVTVGNLPETFTIEGEVLQRKPTFHVSLLCVKCILEKHGDLENKILNFFCSFLKDNDISFVTYTGEFRFAKREERSALIALCEVSHVKEFSEGLGKELGIEIPPQPVHVTLYTLQLDAGIGLNSREDMEDESKHVQVPDEIREALGLSPHFNSKL